MQGSTSLRARIEAFLVWLVLAAGVAHVLATPFVPVAREVGAAWFIGAGLALVLVALLNLARRAVGNRVVSLLCFAGNLLGCTLAGMVGAAVGTPEAFLPLVAVAALTAVSLPDPSLLFATTRR